MSALERNILEYLICCIGAFAIRFGLANSDAYVYLKQHGGISYLYDFYDVEHTFSIEDSVSDVVKICSNNGGL
ncbi:MAG: DUF3791 domain-containing protein [Bacteroidales bacterium]|nr:DUF3791 domain-containing protein [Bacteroidales bacterium]MDD4670880.1 DUF3791 domain-containing protein [Bacteroidales bacterium]